VAAERILLGEGGAWKEAADRAAAVLSHGGIAVLPAEGVYGYHARVDRADALARLRSLKPRDAGRGWIILIAEPGDVFRWTTTPPPRALDLARQFWPGALTLVLPASPEASADVRAMDGTVAVRCPGSEFLRSVLRTIGTALASTSANPPGGSPPVRASDVPMDGVDLVVDLGTLSGVPSTVARLEGEVVRVLRAGPVRVETGPP
jgi:L-threonylcarbamoyladenylate synthase